MFLALSCFQLGAFARWLDAQSAPSANVDERKTPERRLYVAMWTFHFREPETGLENNWLVAGSWGKVFGATFVNSFEVRAYCAGLQDIVARANLRLTSLGLGYRVGLITGYDERFLPIAGKIPVLPFVQPLLHFDAKRLGLELSYSGVVAHTAVNIRL